VSFGIVWRISDANLSVRKRFLFPMLVPKNQTTRHNILENVHCCHNFTSSVSVSHYGLDDRRIVVPFTVQAVLASRYRITTVSEAHRRFLRLQHPVCTTDQSQPSTVEFTNAWHYTSTPTFTLPYTILH
jgi:hypothetical protein